MRSAPPPNQAPAGVQNIRVFMCTAGTSGERMLLCTVTRTLLELKGQDVTFLLGGKNVDTLGHLDLREAFTGQDCAD